MRKSRRRLKRIHPMKNCPLLAALCEAWSDIWICSRRMEDRISTLTSEGGVDPPSRWGHTCLGLWFLNLSACYVHLHCIFYIVISCACFAYLLWNHFVYPYIVSLVVLRNFCRYFIGMTDKARQATAFLSWYRSSFLEVRFVLTLHAWIDCLFFSFYACWFVLKKKKQRGKMQGFSS
jgi:hypothetical protein